MTNTTDHNNDISILRDKIRSLREDQHHVDWRIRFEQELLDPKIFTKLLEEEYRKIAKAFDYVKHLELAAIKAPQMIDELNTLKLLKDEEIYELECKIELIRGASASAGETSRAGKGVKKPEKELSASEKYQAFLRLIPENIQKELGAEKLASLYEASR